ncbi:MAG: glutathione peroxidase [Bacteroidaceae bacterium]|nr:glutathione peroxidase [Bacteroidaceae bacterium]MBR1788160.1 glutathione peroxidase [Bacteroidaceae bacterium]
MKKLLFSIVLLMACMGASAKKNVYQFSLTDGEGRSVSLKEFKGRAMLIVNTATKCGFTPQYKDLETLYEQYHAKGLEIIDLPCNQFGQQAPGSLDEIRQFCTATYGTQFPQWAKVEVNGPGEIPLYTWLKAQKGFGGFDLTNPTGKFLDEMFRKQDANYDKSADIKWNFTKFLIDRKGRVVARFEPTATAEEIEEAVKKIL